jgi:hypothetical protein
MSLRRAAGSILVLALAACTAVTQEPQAPDLVFATFSSPVIPTPNDLVLAQVPAVPCSVMPDGQAQLLCTFVKAGGWPSDQEVPISIPLNQVRWDATPTADFPYGHYAPAATPPTLDAATITASTVTVMRVDLTPPVAAAYDAVVSPGLLTLRKKVGANGRRWDAGARYAVAIRGGPSGVKTTTGLPLAADSAVALVIPNKDLTLTQNQPLGAIPDSNGDGTNNDEISSLESLRATTWQPLTWSNGTGSGPWAPAPSASVTPAFTAINAAFPYAETATIATFGTAPDAGPVVLIDAGSGQAPLPIDLLRTGPNGTIAYNPAFGAAAGGLATLDGFSTTATMLAQTSFPVDASTIVGGNVLLYRLSGSGAPALVKELKADLASGGDGSTAGYVAEPTNLFAKQGEAGCPIAGGCSSVVALQAAAHAPLSATVARELPPLQEGTLYGVVITRRVRDIQGRSLVRPTVAKIILEFTHIVKADGVTSDIPGVGDATAKALKAMQDALAPLWGPGILPAGTTKADVATAYTFKTQSVTGTTTLLAGLPYQVDQAYFAAANTVAITPVNVTSIPFAAFPGVPTAGVNAFYDVTFMSIDAIDKNNGSLNPAIANPASLPSLLVPLHALVVVPDPASAAVQAATCPAGYPAGLRCPRLVIFGHGLNGSKETLLTNAATLASHGFIAAAIDFPLHGGRNWCGADADCVNADQSAGAAGSCDKSTSFAGSAGQGDAVRPGICAGGTSPRVFSAPGVNVPSRYFVSANFFRSRDAFRQNALDVSALTLALNRLPAVYFPPQPATNPFVNALGALGMAVDPTTTYYEGISLGSIGGTSAVAANPRISRAALSVGGGTFIDIGITSPAFQVSLASLFTGLLQGAGALPPGTAFTFSMIDPTSPTFDPVVAAAFLQIVNLAKWVMDPGDPINYAPHLRTSPLPDLLANPSGTVAQAPKEIFSQIALGDTVVPNATNYLLDGLSAGRTTLYQGVGGTPLAHSILATDPTVQAHAAQFLLDLTAPAATVTLP